MQHQGQADTGAEVPGIGGDGDQGLGSRLEQDAVDRRLVLPGDVGDRRRQGEHDMVIGHRQEVGLAGGKPVPGGRALAFGAMAVATRVVGDVGMAAVAAGRHVSAERRRAGIARSPT